MSRDLTNPNTITGQINALALELLDKNPAGIRWVDLLDMIQKAKPGFHPKTINGCVWQLVNNFPDKVHKPKKGLFKLKKNK